MNYSAVIKAWSRAGGGGGRSSGPTRIMEILGDMERMAGVDGLLGDDGDEAGDGVKLDKGRIDDDDGNEKCLTHN